MIQRRNMKKMKKKLKAFFSSQVLSVSTEGTLSHDKFYESQKIYFHISIDKFNGAKIS